MKARHFKALLVAQVSPLGCQGTMWIPQAQGLVSNRHNRPSLSANQMEVSRGLFGAEDFLQPDLEAKFSSKGWMHRDTQAYF